MAFVTNRFIEFHKLLSYYCKFWEGYGDYNFNRYILELFDNILRVTIYNDISWELDEKKFNILEYDSTNLNEYLSKICFRIVANSNEHIIEDKIKLDWILVDDKFHTTANPKDLDYYSSQERDKTWFSGSQLEECKIYAYFES